MLLKGVLIQRGTYVALGRLYLTIIMHTFTHMCILQGQALYH